MIGSDKKTGLESGFFIILHGTAAAQLCEPLLCTPGSSCDGRDAGSLSLVTNGTGWASKSPCSGNGNGAAGAAASGDPGMSVVAAGAVTPAK